MLESLFCAMRRGCFVQKRSIPTAFRELIKHIRETLDDAPGVGLAAPQVGESLQLVIIEDKAQYQPTLTAAELAERERKPVPFHVLINPEIELLSPPHVIFFEGCLSLPGYVAMVARSRSVRVRALNEGGILYRSTQKAGMRAFCNMRSIT